ncbi:hypothetical protein [Nitrospirillum sp. BR 11163]|uniref:hypothetical protein n=1 Tax=Nitrospirillum sp. BR 11163 TaxID=3104323 RepID=UPI002AFDCDD8|nr:hypothetical protein [Nitrospirillum sp. BR 11163]MEA1674068.1 hypothetical protein [Nitrospirillum sp. BR 11163]
MSTRLTLSFRETVDIYLSVDEIAAEVVNQEEAGDPAIGHLINTLGAKVQRGSVEVSDVAVHLDDKGATFIRALAAALDGE